MKNNMSHVFVRKNRRGLAGASALALLMLPVIGHAQQQPNPISGAIGGAAQGTYEGRQAAGPVGGLIGGALGAGVGAVAGTLDVVGNGASQAVRPIDVPPPPGSGSGYYDSNGTWRPN